MPLIQNTYRAEAEAPPDPIHASATAWNLEADPAALRDAAGQLRARAIRAVAAQTTVTESAISLVTNGYWTGDSADLYQGHREKVTTDLGALATALGTAAYALDAMAGTIESGQDQLTTVWDTIKAIPHPRSGHDLVFRPGNETEAGNVRAAMTAADDIRAGVDEALIMEESLLTTTRDDLTAIADTWQPRSIRLLDLNAGQGFGNEPWWWPGDGSKGTDHGDIDEIGQTIAGSGANVVTLQEMFEGDAGRLRDWLNENTDGTWDLHFAAATHKIQWNDSIPPDGGIYPFGNAILVHHGDGIASSEELEELTLHDPGNAGAVNPFGREGRSMEGARIEFTEE